jgi:hypothetical protein
MQMNYETRELRSPRSPKTTEIRAFLVNLIKRYYSLI